MTNDWDWYSEDASVVIPQVLATAVYTNQRQEIVIRQQNAVVGEEDSIIILPRSAVSGLIEALKAESIRDFTEE